MTELDKIEKTYQQLLNLVDDMLQDERIPQNIRETYIQKKDEVLEQNKEDNEEHLKLKGKIIECEKLSSQGILGNIFSDEKFSVSIEIEGKIKIYTSRYMYLKCKDKKNVILEYTPEILEEENSFSSFFYHTEGPKVYEDKEESI